MTARRHRYARRLRAHSSPSGHAALANGHRGHRHRVRPRPSDGRVRVDREVGTRLSGRSGGGLLAVASLLLLLLAAAQGYVSFRAQYTFIDHAKRAHLPSMLEALGLDTGAVIFALLALSLARRSRPAAAEQVLNVACAVGSLTMNLLAANLNSPRSVTVWVLPSALYALASDRLIAVVRRWVQDSDSKARFAAEGSAWRAFGGLAFWTLRLIFDTAGTMAGFRRWVLAVAPVAPGVRAGLPEDGGSRALPAGDHDDKAGEGKDHDAERLPRGVGVQQVPLGQTGPPAPDALGRGELRPAETKREALIRLYERRGETADPRHGDPAKAAELAGEIAARIGYHPGTARRELAKYLAAQRAVQAVLAREDDPPEPSAAPEAARPAAAVKEPETETGSGGERVA